MFCRVGYKKSNDLDNPNIVFPFNKIKTFIEDPAAKSFQSKVVTSLAALSISLFSFLNASERRQFLKVSTIQIFNVLAV